PLCCAVPGSPLPLPLPRGRARFHLPVEGDRTEEPKPLLRHDRTVGINRPSHPAPTAVIRERKPSMNNRSRRRLHTALMTLAAVALAAAASGASTARADSIVYVKSNAIWTSSPDGKRQVKLAAGRRFASPSQADDGTIV